MLQGVHEAVGFGTGWTHVEFRLVRGKPRLVEINARLGGDLILYLGWLATGVDPGWPLRRGRWGCCRPRAGPAAGGSGPVPLPGGGGRRRGGPDRRAAGGGRPGGGAGRARRPARAAPAGHVFGRFGYVTAVADTEAECRAALDAAAGAMRGRPRGRAPLDDRSATGQAGARRTWRESRRRRKRWSSGCS